MMGGVGGLWGGFRGIRGSSEVTGMSRTMSRGMLRKSPTSC
ncbi:MAG: hypothetical protein ACK56F_14840 [bacterium]